MQETALANDDAQPIGKRKRLILVDGYGLAFRAFHALPLSLATPEGEITNATFGFSSMLLDVLQTHQPDYALITFDVGKTFRHDAFEDYKAHRAPMPEEMRQQMTRIREVIHALNIPIYEAEGFEADDVIGTLSVQAQRHGMEAYIITGDSDLLQLVDDHITAVLPGATRFGEYRLYDRPAVVDRYGFGPERLADYKALVGDKSDNIPGVPGIGEKTAKTLIGKYASLEEIIANAADITPTRARNSITENAELARQCRTLATIVRDVPVDLDIERCAIGDFDRSTVLDLFRTLGFRTLMAKLPDSTRRAPVDAESTKSGQIATPKTVRTREALEELAREIAAAPAVAVDVETDSVDPLRSHLVGIAVATSPERAAYIPLRSTHEEVANIADVGETVVPALAAHRRIVTHHGKFDLMVFLQAGLEGFTIAYDTMLAAYLLQEPGLGLKELAFRHLGWEMTNITDLIGTGRDQKTMDQVPLADVTTYAGADVESTLRLQPVLQKEIAARKQTDLLREIEIPLIPVLIDMERTGIAVDTEMLGTLSTSMATQLDDLEARIYELVGHEFNIGSTKQLGTVLFDELGLPTGRKTKTGYSVGQEVLDGLRGAHPVVDAILEHRTLKKLKSTYVDALPLQVNPETGRIHTTYNQTIASTGRLSSTDPNLQNIPIRTAIGRQVRRAFIADNRPGYRPFEEQAVLVSADYSQMELRIMAHFSQDSELVSAFQHGIDVHRATAAAVFGVPIEDVTSEMRSTAKTVNFGIMYGMQAYGLSRDTGMSRQESTRFIEQYMQRFSGVRAYLDQTLHEAVQHGYVSSLYGRRRYVPDITATGPRRLAAERAAINMPLQGSASDIMKIAMIAVAKRLAESRLRARILLQVHDELLFEAPLPELHALRTLAVETMEGIGNLRVPLRVETSYGNNWDEMEDFE